MMQDKLPIETVIKQTKFYNILGMVGGILPLAIVIYLCLGNITFDWKLSLVVSSLLLVGIGNIYLSFKDFKNTSPKIVLNYNGIRLNNIGFFTWTAVLDVVIYTMPGRRRMDCLRLQTNKGYIDFPYSGLNISNFNLQLLIREYRRMETNKK